MINEKRFAHHDYCFGSSSKLTSEEEDKNVSDSLSVDFSMFNNVINDARQLSRLLERQIRAYDNVRTSLNGVEQSNRNNISQAANDLERKTQDLQSKKNSLDEFIRTVTEFREDTNNTERVVSSRFSRDNSAMPRLNSIGPVQNVVGSSTRSVVTIFNAFLGMGHNPSTSILPARPPMLRPPLWPPVPRPPERPPEETDNPEAIPVQIYLPGSTVRTRGYLIGDRTFLDPTGAERIHNGTVVVTPAGVRYVMTSNGGIPVSTLVVNGGAYNNPDTLRAVQERLNALGYLGANGNAIDLGPGLFGPNTLHAVNWFKDQSLPNGNRGELRGVVGQTTLAALFADSAPRANPNYRPGSGPTNPGSGSTDTGSGSTNSGTGRVERLHYSAVVPLLNSYAANGQEIRVRFVPCGTTYNVKNSAITPGTHWDVVTATASDSAIFKSLHRNWSDVNTSPDWIPRAAVVYLGGRQIAAGVRGVVHGGGRMGCGTVGHFCIHFYGSTPNGSSIQRPELPAAINIAVNYG